MNDEVLTGADAMWGGQSCDPNPAPQRLGEQSKRRMAPAHFVLFVCVLCVTSSCKSDGGSVPSGMGGEGPPIGLGGALLEALPETQCAFEIEQELSPVIGTVGVVSWSTSLSPITEAFIQFGRDAGDQMRAPVNLDEDRHRTLLLGMPPETDVRFRVVAYNDRFKCLSDEHRYTTGPGPNGTFFPNMIDRPQAERVTPGFLVTSQFVGGGQRRGATAYILNQDGEIVWWYTTSLNNVSRALLSYDGKHLYARNVNVGRRARGGAVEKISMDGLHAERFELPRSHHDMAATKDNGLVLIAKEDSTERSCDEIVEWFPDGETETIFDVRDAFPSGVVESANGEECHSNSIHYNQFDDSFTFSELNSDSYIKLSSQGELEWVLGGRDSHFAGLSWDRQHGHHLVDETHLFFFNNNSIGQDSLGQYVTLDLEEMTASAWVYEGEGNSSATLGDAQRLPSGNFLMSYSNDGVILEVDSEGEVVQKISFRAGGATGYVNHRASLYGPPAR